MCNFINKEMTQTKIILCLACVYVEIYFQVFKRKVKHTSSRKAEKHIQSKERYTVKQYAGKLT